jgi:hypothetical protein
MPTNTQIGIGVTRMIYSLATPQLRNFEPSGQLYKVMRPTYEYLGTVYHDGDTIPYDVDGSSYSNLAQLERDFNSAELDPAT